MSRVSCLFCCFSPFGFWHLCKESHQTFATSLGGTSFDDFFWRYQCLHNEFKANLKLHLNFCSYGFSRNILILSASNLSSIVSLKCILNMVKIEYNFMETFKFHLVVVCSRVNVQGVKSLGGHFASLCREFDFYKVKKNCYYFSKRKWKHFYTFNHFYSEKSSKRAK